MASAKEKKLQLKVDELERQMKEMVEQMNQLNKESNDWKRKFLETSSAWAVKKVEYEKVLNKKVG